MRRFGHLLSLCVKFYIWYKEQTYSLSRKEDRGCIDMTVGPCIDMEVK